MKKPIRNKKPKTATPKTSSAASKQGVWIIELPPSQLANQRTACKVLYGKDTVKVGDILSLYKHGKSGPKDRPIKAATCKFAALVAFDPLSEVLMAKGGPVPRSEFEKFARIVCGGTAAQFSDYIRENHGDTPVTLEIIEW